MAQNTIKNKANGNIDYQPHNRSLMWFDGDTNKSRETFVHYQFFSHQMHIILNKNIKEQYYNKYNII